MGKGGKPETRSGSLTRKTFAFGTGRAMGRVGGEIVALSHHRRAIFYFSTLLLMIGVAKSVP